jgi:hypothetical protein
VPRSLHFNFTPVSFSLVQEFLTPFFSRIFTAARASETLSKVLNGTCRNSLNGMSHKAEGDGGEGGGGDNDISLMIDLEG